MYGLPYVKRYFDFSKYVNLLNDKFVEVPENTTQVETGQSLSSFSTNIQPHLMPELNGLFDVVFNACTLFYDNITKIESQQYITQSWMNQHYRTGQTKEHIHGNVEFVISCYVSVPKNSGNFEMFYNNAWHTIPVESNDILIFPGSLLHRTEASNSDNPRIVVTMNITKNNGISDLTLSKEEKINRFLSTMNNLSKTHSNIETTLLNMC